MYVRNKLTERAFVCLFVYFFRSYVRMFAFRFVHSRFLRSYFYIFVFVSLALSLAAFFALLGSALGGISKMYIFARLHWLSIELKTAAPLHIPPVFE